MTDTLGRLYLLTVPTGIMSFAIKKATACHKCLLKTETVF